RSKTYRRPTAHPPPRRAAAGRADWWPASTCLVRRPPQVSSGAPRALRARATRESVCGRRCRDSSLPFVSSFRYLRRVGEVKFIGELFPDRPVYSVKPMKRVHYAWIVAAVTFVALMGAAGFRATPGVLIVPLEHEFG